MPYTEFIINFCPQGSRRKGGKKKVISVCLAVVMSGVRAGFINSLVPGKGGRQAKGRGRPGRGGQAHRCVACRYCGSLEGTSRFAFNKPYSSTTGLFLPSLRKRNSEIIDLICNKCL